MTLNIGRESRRVQRLEAGTETACLSPAGKLTRVVEPTAACRLLVSVRDADEAQAAIEGGCDVLDMKEPDRGSLGMCDVSSMESIVDAVHARSAARAAIETSAALGELTDWLDAPFVPKLPAGIDYAKLGLSRTQRIADWKQTFPMVQHRFCRKAERAIRWIAVIYADRDLAQSPAPIEILDVARETDCAGILIDTFEKDGRSLLDWMEPEELHRLTERAHTLQLTVALAGSLRPELLPQLAGMEMDLIAVRSAVCRNGERRGEVSPEAVREFKRAMGLFAAASGSAVQSMRPNA